MKIKTEQEHASRSALNCGIKVPPTSNAGKVIDWLNSKDRREVNSLILDALVMTYLPYAIADQDASEAELTRCYWETQNMTDMCRFNLRQALRISQPQMVATPSYPAPIPANISSQSSSNQVELQENNDNYDEGDDEEDVVPQSLIIGKLANDASSLFGDDEYC